MAVDEYLAGLRKALPGPRRKRADLLAEARDHLVDATEAFEADGLTRTAAERAAVADFGRLSDVVPAYREELSVAQSRNTAALLFGVMILQPLIWQPGVWGWNQDLNGPSELSVLLEQLVRWIGGASIAGAVIAVLATNFGQRYAVVRQHGSRVTAVFALASAVIVSLGGVSMTLESSSTSGHLDVIPVSAFVVAPLLLVALQALRLVRA
ncbi:permease prefix domain 1-containing protein [Kribbella antibiotica]|uniref:permease prefix domain 1-containing protein n=1 Tax=Kribbella antibiotica TaxID=190195 RepID=UPI001EE0663B|nr:permease prefix domain 1-containing protein [Kribbella antibiotica]